MSPVATKASSAEGKGRGSVGDVVAELSEAIRGGDLRFGDPLPAERTLAARLNVSRTTLRKGIRVLADAGVPVEDAQTASATELLDEVAPGTELLRGN